MAASNQSRQKYVFQQGVALGLIAGALLFLGCSSTPYNSSGFPSPRKEIVSYYDRNGDGKVDLEYHAHPWVSEADWELRDDDYNGRYEKKIAYDFTARESVVDIPVPTNVTISPNPPR